MLTYSHTLRAFFLLFQQLADDQYSINKLIINGKSDISGLKQNFKYTGNRDKRHLGEAAKH